MKKSVMILLAVTFSSALLYAADGDLLVNGKLGVGTTAGPGSKLHVVQTATDPAAATYGEFIQQDYACTATRPTDYATALAVGKTAFNMPDTYTTSGWQVGILSQATVIDPNFAGTIADLRGL